MDRRDFIKTSAAAGSLAALPAVPAAARSGMPWVLHLCFNADPAKQGYCVLEGPLQLLNKFAGHWRDLLASEDVAHCELREAIEEVKSCRIRNLAMVSIAVPYSYPGSVYSRITAQAIDRLFDEAGIDFPVNNLKFEELDDGSVYIKVSSC